MFCEKEEKKSKCPKKNFQSVKRGWRKKNYKCGISGVRKKKNWKENFKGKKKNQSVSWGKKKS